MPPIPAITPERPPGRGPPIRHAMRWSDAEGLWAPRSFWDTDPEYREAVVNGCGPRGWKEKLVPDSMWGLSVRIVCNIHDWMYFVAPRAGWQRKYCDDVFIINLRLRIRSRGGWLQRWRLRRANVYHNLVRNWGAAHFHTAFG